MAVLTKKDCFFCHKKSFLSTSRSNLTKFKIFYQDKVKVNARIQSILNLNTKFDVEFEIISIRLWNSSELTMPMQSINPK